QRVHGRIDDEANIAAVPAVAAVRSAERLELLAEDRHAAVPTVASLHLQDDTVDERGHVSLSFSESWLDFSESWLDAKRPVGPSVRRAAVERLSRRVCQTSCGTMLTVLRPRRTPNCTAPADIANNVSS